MARLDRSDQIHPKPVPRGRVRYCLGILSLGAAICLGFFALRALNGYGDPGPWTDQEDPSLTVFSFLSCRKYPPSLLYAMMTLGPAIIALACFDREPGWIGGLFHFFTSPRGGSEVRPPSR